MSTLNDAYRNGQQAALKRFKRGNMMQGAAGYNPTLSGQAASGTAPPTTASPPTPAAPAQAMGAPKAKALG